MKASAESGGVASSDEKARTKKGEREWITGDRGTRASPSRWRGKRWRRSGTTGATRSHDIVRSDGAMCWRTAADGDSAPRSRRRWPD